MAKGNILKEAIADAKAVREVALANAKAALEEAFTPKLKNMLSARLSEELDEEYYEEGDDDMDLELGEIEDDESMEEMMYDEDEKDMDEMMYDEDEKDSMDEEIDLEEILNELELEESDVAEEKEEEIEETKDEDDKEKVEETFDLDTLLQEITSLDKKVKPKRPKKTTRIAENNRTVSRGKRGTKNACRESQQAVLKLKHELNESNKALQSVRGELNEVNLLNSKLLYVNRIFKQNSLDDPQKLRVVETLDKANSVKEAKLIYETIKDSFSISNEALEKEIQKEIRNTVKSRKPRKPIRENLGMASKAAGISRTKKLAPKRAVINESDNMMKRFQKLANIKINE